MAVWDWFSKERRQERRRINAVIAIESLIDSVKNDNLTDQDKRAKIHKVAEIAHRSHENALSAVLELKNVNHPVAATSIRTILYNYNELRDIAGATKDYFSNIAVSSLQKMAAVDEFSAETKKEAVDAIRVAGINVLRSAADSFYALSLTGKEPGLEETSINAVKDLVRHYGSYDEVLARAVLTLRDMGTDNAAEAIGDILEKRASSVEAISYVVNCSKHFDSVRGDTPKPIAGLQRAAVKIVQNMVVHIGDRLFDEDEYDVDMISSGLDDGFDGQFVTLETPEDRDLLLDALSDLDLASLMGPWGEAVRNTVRQQLQINQKRDHLQEGLAAFAGKPQTPNPAK